MILKLSTVAVLLLAGAWMTPLNTQKPTSRTGDITKARRAYEDEVRTALVSIRDKYRKRLLKLK